jgi:transketolase
LRAVPNLQVFRPADGKETAAAWITALQGSKPTCIALSRQNLPQYLHPTMDYLKGGYILAESLQPIPDAILIATGSEVEIAMKAKPLLQAMGIDVRVVSMPSQEVFEAQPESYKRHVLPPNVKNRVSIEAGSTLGWYKYVGLDGLAIGIDEFGLSAPANQLYQFFGLTADVVAVKTAALVAKNK